MSYQDGLTPEQLEVVLSDSPRLFVVAGAGSGKTRVLAARFLHHVVANQLRPDQILTLTFTRKAATEMRERIVKGLMQEGRNEDAQIAETSAISTFHSFCERVLRENAIDAGLDPEFEIADELSLLDLRKRLVEEFVSTTDFHSVEVTEFLSAVAGAAQYDQPWTLDGQIFSIVRDVLSRFRGTLHTPEELRAIYQNAGTLASKILKEMDLPETDRRRQKFESNIGTSELQTLQISCGIMQVALSIWESLDRILLENQTLDFNLLESRLLWLIRTRPQALERIRRQYPVALVDEAQDMNPVQYAILDTLNLSRTMFVGDPQQSIYAFRQADRKLFVQRAAQSDCLRLSTNFRSSRRTLQMVDAVFKSIWGEEYFPMVPRPDAPSGESEIIESGEPDARAIAQKVQELIAGRDYIPGDITVLVRNRKEGKLIQSELSKIGIKQHFEGSTSFFNHLPIRDLANLIDAICTPENDFALLCSLHGPACDLSLNTVVRLAIQAKEAEKPCCELLQHLEPSDPEDQEKLQKFLGWYSDVAPYADRYRAWELIAILFNRTPFLRNIALRQDAHQALANVRKLHQQAISRQELAPSEFAEQIRAIDRLAYSEEDAVAVEDARNAVTIMNVHKAKGLEFPVAVVAHGSRNLANVIGDLRFDQASGLLLYCVRRNVSVAETWLREKMAVEAENEEIRVLYVAMTRAKDVLVVPTQPEAQTGWPKVISNTTIWDVIQDVKSSDAL